MSARFYSWFSGVLLTVSPVLAHAEDFDTGYPVAPPPMDGGGYEYTPPPDAYYEAPPPPAPIPVPGDPNGGDDSLSAGGARGTNPGESYREESDFPRQRPGVKDFAPAPKESEIRNAAEGDGEDSDGPDEDELEAAVTPAPPPAPESIPDEQSGRSGGTRVSRAKVKELLIPLYQRHKPQWAIGLIGSMQAFGSGGSAGGSSTNVYATAIQAEFQPRILQRFGVLGIGPTFTIYPNSGLTSSTLGLWSIGGQVRYQARFFREQPLVPVAGYEMGQLKYSLSGGSSGTLSVSGPFFGAWFLLNVADESSAASFFAEYGISRSYLVGELHMTEASDSAIELAGNIIYFGLRVEF